MPINKNNYVGVLKVLDKLRDVGMLRKIAIYGEMLGCLRMRFYAMMIKMGA